MASVPLQQSLRHLQAAFTGFFDKRARYPRFKSRKKSKASAEYTRSAFRWRDGQLRLARMRDPLNIVWSRSLPEGAEPSAVTVSRDAAGRWFCSMLVETCIEHHPPTDQVIVIDPWFPSSKTCSACGLLLDALPLGVREWTCACGVTHDRDLDAARNILAAGLAVTACGDRVRPTRH